MKATDSFLTKMFRPRTSNKNQSYLVGKGLLVIWLGFFLPKQFLFFSPLMNEALTESIVGETKSDLINGAPIVGIWNTSNNLNQAANTMSRRMVEEKYTESNVTIVNKEMKLLYRFWNHTTQQLNLPSYDISRPPSSLKLLEQIIEDQRDKTLDKQSDECFFPDTTATHDLANQVRSGRIMPLPKPIINVGFPKAGSTTISKYFQCNNWNVPNRGQYGHKQMELLRRGEKHALAKSYPTADVEVYGQVDNSHGTCAYPQIQFLEEIHEEFPNATFIMTSRPVDDWIRSVSRWYNLLDRLAGCHMIPGLLCTGEKNDKGLNSCTPDNLRHWWCSHVKHVREFTKRYPSHKLVEVNLYNNSETGQLLGDIFATNASCWGHANAH